MRRTGLACGALLGAALLEAAVLAPRRFGMPEHDLALDGWPDALDGLRVAVVGDVHAGAPWVTLRRVRDVVEQVVQARPDLVLLVGDDVADVALGTHLDVDEVAVALGGLADGGAPVVSVLGNHDWYAGGHRVRAALERAGVPVLENAAVPVLDGRLWVAGISDLWEASPDVPTALAAVPDDAPLLLMSHNPDCVVDVPSRVALVVSGHTHGGQVAVRGRPLHQVSERTGNQWCKGFYADERLFITAGVGSSLIPLRTVRPEVPVLTLRPRR